MSNQLDQSQDLASAPDGFPRPALEDPSGATIIDHPRRGQPVWMIVNNEPALRYFLNPVDDLSSVVAFDKDLSRPYVDRPSLFFQTEADVIIYLIHGVLRQIEHNREELRARCGRLAALAAVNEPANDGIQ